jgi:hypothetical protein
MHHEVESQLHKKFESCCVEGEWFKTDIHDVIEALGEITLLSHSPKVTVGSDEIVTREFKGKAIRQRADGYFEATTQEFLAELSIVTNIHIKSQSTIKRVTEQNQYLIDIIPGGIPEKQGSWVHPLVATNLAQWCRPELCVELKKTMTCNAKFNVRLVCPPAPTGGQKKHWAVQKNVFELNLMVLHQSIESATRGYPMRSMSSK